MQYGCRIGIVDIPNNRSSHTKVIPKGGGIGIVMVLAVSSLILSISIGIWLPAIVISLVSLWGGDKHCLSPKLRLLLHFACSIFFLVFWGFSKGTGLSSVLLFLPLAFFIVGTANFYNFMDGIDGIAGITGVVGFSLLAFYSDITGIGGVYSSLCMVMAFSCLGFLCFNMPKAKVFLGDIGSILLGFIFACMIIVLSENILDFFVMTGFLATFYFDELFTMVIRIQNEDSLLVAHRKHIYQLLANEFSISHWKIALLYGLVQSIIGLTAIYIKPMGLIYIILLYLMYCFIFVVISINIHKKVVRNES